MYFVVAVNDAGDERNFVVRELKLRNHCATLLVGNDEHTVLMGEIVDIIGLDPGELVVKCSMSHRSNGLH